MDKNLKYVILAIAIMFASSWIFNHISPWIGIGFLVGSLIFLINKLIKNLKN